MKSAKLCHVFLELGAPTPKKNNTFLFNHPRIHEMSKVSSEVERCFTEGALLVEHPSGQLIQLPELPISVRTFNELAMTIAVILTKNHHTIDVTHTIEKDTNTYHQNISTCPYILLDSPDSSSDYTTKKSSQQFSGKHQASSPHPRSQHLDDVDLCWDVETWGGNQETLDLWPETVVFHDGNEYIYIYICIFFGGWIFPH